MSAVVEFVEDTFDAVGDFVESVGDAIEDVADAVVDVVESVGTAVEAIIEDPLPTLLMIAGSTVGIPPWITSAAVTAARGGDLEDIVLSAGTAAVAPMIVGPMAGSISSTLVESGVDAAIANTVATSVGKGFVSGVVAEVKGNDFADGFTGGFVGGVVGAGVQEVTSIVSDAFATVTNDAINNVDGTGNSTVVAAFDTSVNSPANVNTPVNVEFSNFVENYDFDGTGNDAAINLSVDNGSGIPDYVVNDVVVANGGTDNPPMTDTDAPVVVEEPVVDNRPVSEISVLPSVKDADTFASVATDVNEPPVGLSDAPPAESDNNFQDLIDADPDANLGGAESAILPVSVADIAEDFPEDVAPEVVAPTVLETPATPVVSGLESVSKGLTGVTSEPIIDDLISEGVVPDTTSGGLNAVVPRETAGDLSATKEFKASDIIKPLVASAGNLLKSSITKSLMPTKKPTPRPTARPVGGLQAVKPVAKTSAPPPRQMDVSKLTPINKAVPVKKPAPTGPAKTLAGNANLTPVSKIANLTSLVKKVG